MNKGYFNRNQCDINKKQGTFLCVLLSIMFLIFVYGSAFFQPNNFLFNANGDGIKNYFNVASHLKNDTSFSSLNSIAYPYGESLLLEDSMPALNTLLKACSYLFPGIQNYTIGILNFLMLLSLAIAAWCLYKIFLHYEVKPIVSAFSANAIAILSSQFMLMGKAGHWGLTFVCFFPLGWWLLIEYRKSSKKWKWSAIIAANSLFWAFTHIYLGFIILIFNILAHSFFLFRKKEERKNFLQISLQTIIPLLIIFLLIKLNDQHANRIDMPFIADYRASFYSVFMPNVSIFKSFYEIFFDLKPQESQTWARIGNYIGLTSNLAIISFSILSLYFLFKKRFSEIKQKIPADLLVFLLAAIVTLLYSMAIPMQYLPERLQNLIPYVKQFSALGRFAWAFYFVICVASVLFFYKILYKKKYGKILFCLLLFLYFAESTYHLTNAKEIRLAKNELTYKYLSRNKKELLKINTAQFQALLPIPSYFSFNLPIDKEMRDSSITTSMIYSYHSGLPIFSVYLSRPSVTEGMKIFSQLLQAPFRKPMEWFESHKKDILILFYMPDSVEISGNEKEILKESNLVKNVGNFQLRSFKVENFLKKADNTSAKKNFLLKKEKLIEKNGLYLMDTSLFVFYNSFDSLPVEPNYLGGGALRREKPVTNFLFETSTSKMDTSTVYELSFWYYNYIWNQSFTTAIIHETDENNKDLQYLYYSPLSTSIIDSWWYFSRKEFKIKSRKSNLRIYIQGSNLFEDWIAVDELLLRPKRLDVFKISKQGNDSIFLLNNLKIK